MPFLHRIGGGFVAYAEVFYGYCVDKAIWICYNQDNKSELTEENILKDFSVPKTLINIAIYFLLFIFGDLFNSLIFDLLFSVVKLPSSEFYVIIRMLGCLSLTLLFFWLYTTKGLHLKMSAFGMTVAIKKWGILFAVLLPAFVVFVFLLVGRTEVNSFSFSNIILVVIASMITALKAGILEEMLFRGFIMKLVENRWNKYIAILMPSFIFSLLHLPSMKTFTIDSVILLIISGTLVGTMFSLVAYKGNSIANSILMHTLWNFVMITSILHITTEQGSYGNPIFSIIIPSDNILLTGAGFGVEASLIAIIGYACICAVTLWSRKK